MQLERGVVLDLRPGDRSHAPEQAMRLRVERVRDDLSKHYGGRHVWVEGHLLDDAGVAGEWTQVLVKTSAIPGAIERAAAGGGTSGG